MVGEAERERVAVAKVGASSALEAESISDERSAREDGAGGAACDGEGAREERFWDGERGTGGVARELGGWPACVVNWPFVLRVTESFGGMRLDLGLRFWRGGDNEFYKLLPSRSILGVGSR
jgi:hypothetical protein